MATISLSVFFILSHCIQMRNAVHVCNLLYYFSSSTNRMNHVDELKKNWEHYLPIKVSFWCFMSLTSTWIEWVQHALFIHFAAVFLAMWWCNDVIPLKDMNLCFQYVLGFVAAEACFLIKYSYSPKSRVQCFSSVPLQITLFRLSQTTYLKKRRNSIALVHALRLRSCYHESMLVGFVGFYLYFSYV